MKTYLLLSLIIIGTVLPTISFAGLPDFNGPFVICGRSSINQADCTLCDIFKMAQLIVDLLIGLIIIIGPILIAVGGGMILFAGADPGLLSKGKSVIKNVVIGLIIALLAWTAIDTIFNKLANPGQFPWPWNKIECTGGGVTDAPETPETPPVEEGKFCVCETPVYDLNPADSGASQIGTNAKVYLNFADKEECLEKCVSANASTYCHSSLKMDAAKLYCASDTGLKSVSACTLNEASSNCQVSSNCYNSQQECFDATLTTFAKKCYLNDQAMCTCYTGASKNTCGNSSSKYVIYQTKKEATTGDDTSLFDCGGTSSTYCRIGCDYQKCIDTPTNSCGDVKASFSCFDGKYTCKQMLTTQERDACSELKSILSCMSSKLSASDRIITSISDNSPITYGNLGRCFNPTSNSGTCSSDKDSCDSSCCGHSLCSLHYGGYRRSDFGPTNCSVGSVDCRSCSLAVDFANGTNEKNLENAAEECAEQLWDGSLEDIWINPEGNHNHLQLDGWSKYKKCGTNH